MTYFNITAFINLPKNLKKSDYIDLLLFLCNLKKSIRLGNNNFDTYLVMKNWCDKYNFSYTISSSNLMYISKFKILCLITQLIDDSSFNHSYILGRILGYPKCCCKKIALVGEKNIDNFEADLFNSSELSTPYELINSSYYTDGTALISHVPCSHSCEESLKIALKAKKVITRHREFKEMSTWINFWNFF